MMKKVWLVLLAVVLVFGLAVLGCSSGGGSGPENPNGPDPNKPEPGKVIGTLKLDDNFQYGDGYQGLISDILKKKKNYTDDISGKIEEGQTYALRIKFTASRPLEDRMQIGLVDTVTNYWAPLSWDGTDDTTSEATGNYVPQADIDAATAENPCVVIMEFKILKSAAGPGAGENSLMFQTKGQGEKGQPGSGVKKAVTLSFYEFVFIKGTKEDLPAESKPPEPPEPPVGGFDIDALPGIVLSVAGGNPPTYNDETKVVTIDLDDVKGSTSSLVYFKFEDAGYTYKVGDILKVNYACILDAAEPPEEGEEAVTPEVLPFNLKSGANSWTDIANENYNNGRLLEGTESGSFTVDMFRLFTGKQDGLTLQYNAWYGGAAPAAIAARLKILSVEVLMPTSPFKVQFVNKKADGSYTKLNEVEGGVETGGLVTDPAGAAWAASLAGAGEKLDGWKVLGTDAAWNFATSTVTTNIVLYPVVVKVPSVTGVTVSPATISVLKGGTQQFTATVTGVNDPATTVTWSVEAGVDAGTTISTAGLLTVAAAEAKTSFKVTATSTADTSKSGEATVSVTAVLPTVTSVAVTPKTASVVKGGTQKFTAAVTGTLDFSKEVTWKVDTAGVKPGTKFTGDVFTLASDETVTSITISATSVVDNTKSDTATVTINTSFLVLGPPVSDWWGTENIEDNPITGLTYDIFKGAKYLILKVTSLAENNGFGGIQLAVQSDGDEWGWHQQSICGGWNQPKADNGQWDIAFSTVDTFYVIVDFSTWDDWNTLVAKEEGTKGKLKKNSWPGQITLEDAWLVTSTGSLAKPGTALDITNGWAAKTVPEIFK